MRDARPNGELGKREYEQFQQFILMHTVSNTQNLRGELDEIRIYGRALSADELRQQFDEQSPLVVE